VRERPDLRHQTCLSGPKGARQSRPGISLGRPGHLALLSGIVGLPGEVASHRVVSLHVCKRWIQLRTDLWVAKALVEPAAGMESTPQRGRHCARDVTGEDDALPPRLDGGVGYWNRRPESNRVGVKRAETQGPRRGHLHDSAQVHDGRPVADPLDNR